jgi:transmembrane sensor
MTGAPHQLEPTDVDGIAATWFARSRSGTMDTAEQAALDSWLAADASHRQAYEHYVGLWSALGDLRDEPHVLALREDLASARYRPWQIAAVVAIAACLALVLLVLPRATPHGMPTALASASAPTVTRFETGVGQVSRIALADGSTVVIDTDSALKTIFDGHRRRILLERGRAFFHVAHEARPFIVIGQRVSVTATGTQFVVDLHDNADIVSMVEGRVIAAPVLAHAATEPVALTAGKSLTADSDGAWEVGAVDVDRERDWLTGELTFRNATLDEIVRETNRYSPRKISLGDTQVGQQRLSAILKAGDVDTLTSAVRDLGIARVSSRDADTIVLSRR